MSFLRQTIISLLVMLFVSLATPVTGHAEYATGVHGSHASSSQTLQIQILPAVEMQELGRSEPIYKNHAIEQTIYLGARANTSWTVDIGSSSTGFIEPLQWQVVGASGQSNEDESLQTFSVVYRQPLSWADDQEETSITISQEIAPSI